jgi:hypothetical protein
MGFWALATTKPDTESEIQEPINSVFIEKKSGLAPLDQGFKLWSIGKFEFQTVQNNSRTAYDTWKIISDDQAYYYRTLTASEKNLPSAMIG